MATHSTSSPAVSHSRSERLPSVDPQLQCKMLFSTRFWINKGVIKTFRGRYGYRNQQQPQGLT
jgi:hypothetical protein